MELERQKLTPTSVPAEGREVLIQRNANHAFDCTDEVHPETAELASLAARIVGLDIAGIDLVCQDISKPLAEQGGAIVEVNAGPSLLMHIKPGIGKPRPVGQAIVNNLFAEGLRGRVPLVGVTGTHGATAVAKLVAHLIYMSGQHAGLACSDGIFLGRRQVQKTDAANWEGGRRLLLNRAVEAAVIENGAASFSAKACPTTAARSASSPTSLPKTKTCRAGMSSRPAASTTRRIVRSTGPRSMSCCPAAMPSSMPRTLVADLPSCAMARSFSSPPTQPARPWRAPGRRQARGYVSRQPHYLGTGTEEIRLCRLGDVPVIGKQKDPATIANVLAALLPAGQWI
jgi:cyanophycin synthetase